MGIGNFGIKDGFAMVGKKGAAAGSAR